jgi:hypothetical protein
LAVGKCIVSMFVLALVMFHANLCWVWATLHSVRPW